MTRQEQYRLDQMVEKQVADFVDKNFYMQSKLSADVQRWTDTTHQYAGVDLTVKNINIDEKVKYKGCLNSVLQYPSFELKFTNKADKRQDGWFYSALSTDYYALMSVSADTDAENELSGEGHILAVDILLVKKSDVQEMVSSNITEEQLKKDIEELEDENCLDALLGWDFSKARKKYEHGKFWLTYSKKLREKPVNLVTTREVLEQLPHTKHVYVTKGKAYKK